MRWYLVLVAWGMHGLSCQGQDGFIKGEPALAYWQVGTHQRETVIVLHGGPSVQHEYLRPEFDGLKQSANVIYYDQRGCGKSQIANSYLWQEHVADLKRVINTFSKKGGKVYLAGSSWGSLLGIIYAYMFPGDVKGLILSGTVLWPGKDAIYKRTRLFQGKPEKMYLYDKRIVTTCTSDSQVKMDTVVIWKEAEIWYGSPQVETLESLISAPSLACLAEVQPPVLMFTGTYNRGDDGTDQYAKLFPNVRVHTFVGAGHDPWLSDPRLFASTSNAFIRYWSRQKPN